MDNRLFFPATQRNKESIGNVLSKIIQNKGLILEIGSGSGEHGVIFQKRFPQIIWQTSDPKLLHRKSISSWIKYEKLNAKMPPPIELDVEKIPWELPYNLTYPLEGIVAINIIHVAHWNCTEALFSESGKLLRNGQFLMLYGPFKIDNKHTSHSNYLFDNSLKKQYHFWGIRNLEEVNNAAKKNGFIKEEIINMPSNNFSIIYRKLGYRMQ